MATENPFTIDTDKPFVALKGLRCGYIQLATTTETTTYETLPIELLVAAKAWASALQQLGAKRVYWITLAEVVPHLHIHLYPRWTDEEEQGISLFEKRNTAPQPVWAEETLQQLLDWANEYQVETR